jgi:competence protein ComEC
VLRLRYGAVEFLLTGDAGAEFESRQEASGAAARLRIIKVGHHGSRSSSAEAFVAGYRPDVALVSVGRGNVFSHPAPVVIGRYLQARAEILRTDRDGAVMLESDGRTIEVRTAGGRRLAMMAWEGASGSLPAPSRAP